MSQWPSLETTKNLTFTAGIKIAVIRAAKIIRMAARWPILTCRLSGGRPTFDVKIMVNIHPDIPNLQSLTNISLSQNFVI